MTASPEPPLDDDGASGIPEPPLVNDDDNGTPESPLVDDAPPSPESPLVDDNDGIPVPSLDYYRIPDNGAIPDDDGLNSSARCFRSSSSTTAASPSRR